MVRTFVGAHVDYALDKFARWACERDGHTYDTKTIKLADTGRRILGYVIPDYVSGDPYITRVLLPKLGETRAFLHHIHRADHERDLHDHPWSWSFSIVLCGSYDEERPTDCHHSDCTSTKTRRVRWFNFIRGTDVHRITQLHGDVWTLFVHGPRHGRSWGFREWDSGYERWNITPSEQYIARKKIEKQMSGLAMYYGDPTFDVQVVTGNALDAWGKILNCPRDPGLAYTPQGQDVPETDVEYRARLIARIRGEYGDPS